MNLWATRHPTVISRTGRVLLKIDSRVWRRRRCRCRYCCRHDTVRAPIWFQGYHHKYGGVLYLLFFFVVLRKREEAHTNKQHHRTTRRLLIGKMQPRAARGSHSIIHHHVCLLNVCAWFMPDCCPPFSSNSNIYVQCVYCSIDMIDTHVPCQPSN